VRVFLDANILFSAAKTNGAVRALLALLIDRGHALVADGYVVAEARRNLLSKGPTAIQDLDALLGDIEIAPFRADRLPADLARLIAAKDQPVIAAAIRLRCDALVTGDSTHFGQFYGTVRHGVAIHSPRSLAEALTG
jgi:uncharacterized protein